MSSTPFQDQHLRSPARGLFRRIACALPLLLAFFALACAEPVGGGELDFGPDAAPVVFDEELSLDPEALAAAAEELFGDRAPEAATGDTPSQIGFNFSRSKRDYCCIQKDDIGRVRSCLHIRDYRDELGRFMARDKCAKSGFDWTHNTLVSASCSNRPECPPMPPKPPKPTCENGGIAHGATWKKLRPGTSCVMVSYSCQFRRVVETGTTRVPGCIER